MGRPKRGAILGSLHRGRAWVDTVIGESKVGAYFEMEKRRTNFTREVAAGTVTFLTMAYILSINASILSESGGPCSVDDCTDQLRQNLITATAASSIVSCVIMGGFANMPVALAPGLGLNAYFAYNVTSYETALAAVFIEGWIFILLSVTGARAKLIEYVPRSIALSMSAGIGMFLAFVGLQSEEGLGVSVLDTSTLVSLGGCPVDNWVSVYAIANKTEACANPGEAYEYPLMRASTNHMCGGHKMSSAHLWLGLSGLAVMTVLMHRGWKGSVITGILFVTFISWIPGHGASYLGSSSRFPGGIGGNGEARLAYFKKVVQAPSLSLTGGKLNFHGLADGSAWLALITFLYTDFLDCTGTLFSMANFMNSFIPGFVNRKKQFPKSTWAFSADGCGIVVGSVMGSSPVTAYIESATGIKEGARTGIAALTVALCFFISLFFNPLIASIPPFATGPAIILVGALMMVNIVKIRWNNVNEAVPAFLTMIVMPLTYSIAYGVVAGLVAYIVTNSVNLGMDWVADRLWEWRNGQTRQRGPQITHSGSQRFKQNAAMRDRTFTLHHGGSSKGGDDSGPGVKLQRGSTFADPSPGTKHEHAPSLGGMSTADSSFAGDGSRLGDDSQLGDTTPFDDMVKQPIGPKHTEDSNGTGSLQKATDSAVELTSPRMQRPYADSPDKAAPSTPPASEAGTEEAPAPAQPSTGSITRDSAAYALGRDSVPPVHLTSDEMSAMVSPFANPDLESRSPNLASSGVDMYSTDSEVTAGQSNSLGPKRKSVAEAYEDLWS